MPIYLGTHLINHVTGHGWSENWYLDDTSHESALVKIDQLANVRRQVLGASSTLVGSRVSDVTIRGDSLTNFYGFGPFVTGPEGAADSPWSAVCWKISAGGHLYRRFWMCRGVPDSYLTYDSGGELILTTALNNFRTSMANLLVASNYRMKVIDKDPPNGTPINATDYNVDESGHFRISMDTGSVENGMAVRLQHWETSYGPDKRLVNRSYRIVDVTPTAISIDLNYADIAEPTLLAAGQVVRKIFAYKPLTTFNFYGKGHRDTGRAFFVSRGRRRARR